MSETKSAFDDPRVDAKEYLESKGVLKLFQELGTSVVYNRPDDIRSFLIEELKRLKEVQKQQQLGSAIFTEKDVETMFGMFDPTGTGVISKEQAKQGFASLCLTVPDLGETVSKEDFCRLAKEARAL